MIYNVYRKDVSVYVSAKEDNSMDNGFMSYIQLFIDFILKLIALFMSNDNTESNKKD